MAGGIVLTATVPTSAGPSTSSRGESTFRSKSKPVAESPNARAKCAAKPAGVRRGHHVFVKDTFQIASPDFIPEETPGRHPGFVEETPSRTRLPKASIQLCQISLSATWRSRCSPPWPFKNILHPANVGNSATDSSSPMWVSTPV
ncbi:hypothetical protein BDR22DRAFT_961056 [Usnea florida]